MNQAAFNLTYRKELPGTVQNETLLWVERSRNKDFTLRIKADWLWQDYFPLGDDGVYQANYLISADEVIPEL